jgi:hypothetical protein
MSGPQRKSKRYSHGHHLTPQDANAARVRKRRNEVPLDSRERGHHLSERGYRSDNRPREWHGHDGDRERYHASSSRRLKNDNSHREESYSETDTDTDEEHWSTQESVAPLRRIRDDHILPVAKETEGSLSRSSHSKSYGEHRYDDPWDERYGTVYPKLTPTASGVSPPSLARKPIHVHVSPYPSMEAAYGDYPEYHRTQAKPSYRGKSISITKEYSEHHLNSDHVTKASSMDPVAEEAQNNTDFSSPPPPLANDSFPGSNSKRGDGTTGTSSRDGIRTQPRQTPEDMHRTLHAALPARTRDSSFTSQERVPLDDLDNEPSISRRNEISNADRKIPRLSLPAYTTEYSNLRSDLATLEDLRPGAINDMQRPRSASGGSITSTKMPSQSPSSAGSGVLGPKTYQYRPLQPSQIRLVRVLPERMWKLKCEIIHVSLENEPVYTAISVSHYCSLKAPANTELTKYAWGDGVDTRPLVLEGATIPVAVSLHDALRAVRRKKENILVWVDALCIDQQNEDERATQVRLMGQIYSGAMSVAIWIGPEYEDSALALQLLQKVAENSVSPQRIRSTCNLDSLALLNLFKRDYWKRLWGKWSRTNLYMGFAD